jgi:hypothetical protein
MPRSTGKNGHGAEFPLALPGRCIALTSRPADLVLEPFSPATQPCAGISAHPHARRQTLAGHRQNMSQRQLQGNGGQHRFGGVRALCRTACRQTRHGVTHLLELRIGYGKTLCSARRRQVASTESGKRHMSPSAGSATRARYPGQQPIPGKVDQWNELPAIRSNPHSYRNPAASDGQRPILTRSPVGPFMPEPYRRRAAVKARDRCRGVRTRSSASPPPRSEWRPRR